MLPAYVMVSLRRFSGLWDEEGMVAVCQQRLRARLVWGDVWWTTRLGSSNASMPSRGGLMGVLRFSAIAGLDFLLRASLAGRDMVQQDPRKSGGRSE